MKLGLYFIPTGSELYRRGSKWLGYDIAGQQDLTPYKDVTAAWTTDARKYGFHMSITDAFIIPEQELEATIAATRNLLTCFMTDTVFLLSLETIDYWPRADNQLAIRYRPNRSLQILHDTLIATIQARSQGTGYTAALAAQEAAGMVTFSSEEIAKIKQFHSFTIFDNFKPHFTLLNPFTGTATDRQAMRNFAIERFQEFAKLRITELAVTVQPDQARNYYIHGVLPL